MNKLNVAVVYGGVSPEHEVSKSSAASVVAHMREEKYNVMPVYVTREGKWLMYDGKIDNVSNIQWDKFGTPAVLSPDASHRGLLRLVGGKVKVVPVDVIFPLIHGRNGEDGTMQGLFEVSGVPYVGCGVLASAVAMDKTFGKLVAASLGLRQADYLVFSEYELADMDEAAKKSRYKIGYPCFVKPANSGSSVGISKACNKRELVAAFELAARYDNKVIVEKAVAGRELECAVLELSEGGAEASAVGEIIANADFYDFDAKYNSEDSQTIVPADIPKEYGDEVRGQAVKMFRAIGGRGLARVDFFLEQETNRVIFNEINTIPGFTAISLYPKLWRERGVRLQELIDRLILLGIIHSERRKTLNG
ncbi:MAG: D-alanine--D-alanine ligase [Clostridiales bacterium]|jgi:D-alanine-D-alanine ligase|nr:D-alanine--D-alanine ligase [Clostridiales bacterium]